MNRILIVPNHGILLLSLKFFIFNDRRELVRIMNTRKCITTSMINDRGERIYIGCCSKPETKVAALYDALQMKPAPFTRKKSAALKIEPEENRLFDFQADTI